MSQTRWFPGARGRDAAALFREVWQPPPHTGPLDDENRRITPQALTNPDLEYRLYGTDARNIQVTEHNGVPDLWTGFTTSPVALTLRHKSAYLDLTLTRMRWRTRTENLHVLHPVVKLADGTLLVGSQTFSSPQRPMVGSNAFSGNFVVSGGDVRPSNAGSSSIPKKVVVLEGKSAALSSPAASTRLGSSI